MDLVYKMPTATQTHSYAALVSLEQEDATNLDSNKTCLVGTHLGVYGVVWEFSPKEPSRVQPELPINSEGVTDVYIEAKSMYARELIVAYTIE
jgi:hypothetical protein